VKKVFHSYSDGKMLKAMAYLWAWNPFLRSGARNWAASLARRPSFWCPDSNI